MKPGEFATPRYWLQGAHLGLVTDVQDPEGGGRVKVQLMGPDGDGAAQLWARVAVPFAGANCGAWFIPNVDDEVVLVFIGGDSRHPVVVGSLWNGRNATPESVTGSAIDRWTLTGINGTRIAIVESSPGQEMVEIETPLGNRATITDAEGGSIKLETPSGSSITADPAGVKVQTSAKAEVQASTVQVTAGMVTVDAGMSKFSGVVKCDTLIATSVVSGSYTPGAGNIW